MMARSNHARYTSRTDKLERQPRYQSRPPSRRQATRHAIIAAAMQEV